MINKLADFGSEVDVDMSLLEQLGETIAHLTLAILGIALILYAGILAGAILFCCRRTSP